MMSRTLAQIATDHVFLTWLASIGLVLFLGVFVGALIWTTRRNRAEFYRAMSQIPLEEETSK